MGFRGKLEFISAETSSLLICASRRTLIFNAEHLYTSFSNELCGLNVINGANEGGAEGRQPTLNKGSD